MRSLALSFFVKLDPVTEALWATEIVLLTNAFFFHIDSVQDYYMRQIDMLNTPCKDTNKEAGIIIHFAVAGQITEFRTLENRSNGPIDVMPVHVEDVFRRNP